MRYARRRVERRAGSADGSGGGTADRIGDMNPRRHDFEVVPPPGRAIREWSGPCGQSEAKTSRSGFGVARTWVFKADANGRRGQARTNDVRVSAAVVLWSRVALWGTVLL